MSATGHETTSFTWSHAVGQRWRKEIALRAAAPAKPEPKPVVTKPKPVKPEPAVPLRPKDPDPDPIELRTEPPAWMTPLKWSAIGVGGAALVGGVVLLAMAPDARDEMERLNEENKRANPTHDGYSSEFDSAKSTYETRQYGGAALAGIGAALAVAGGVLFVFDRPTEPPAASAAPMWLPGGGGMSAQVGF